MPNCERCLTYAAAGRDVLRLQEEYQVLGLQLEQLDLGQRSLREDRAALAQEAIAALDQTLAAVQSPVRVWGSSNVIRRQTTYLSARIITGIPCMASCAGTQ